MHQTDPQSLLAIDDGEESWTHSIDCIDCRLDRSLPTN